MTLTSNVNAAFECQDYATLYPYTRASSALGFLLHAREPVVYVRWLSGSRLEATCYYIDSSKTSVVIYGPSAREHCANRTNGLRVGHTILGMPQCSSVLL